MNAVRQLMESVSASPEPTTLKKEQLQLLMCCCLLLFPWEMLLHTKGEVEWKGWGRDALLCTICVMSPAQGFKARTPEALFNYQAEYRDCS